MSKLKHEGKDSYYCGAAHVAFSDSDKFATIAMRFTLKDAILMRNAFIKAVDECQGNNQFNMSLFTIYKETGRATLLTKKRVSPLKRGDAALAKNRK